MSGFGNTQTFPGCVIGSPHQGKQGPSDPSFSVLVPVLSTFLLCLGSLDLSYDAYLGPRIWFLACGSLMWTHVRRHHTSASAPVGPCMRQDSKQRNYGDVYIPSGRGASFSVLADFCSYYSTDLTQTFDWAELSRLSQASQFKRRGVNSSTKLISGSRNIQNTSLPALVYNLLSYPVRLAVFFYKLTFLKQTSINGWSIGWPRLCGDQVSQSHITGTLGWTRFSLSQDTVCSAIGSSAESLASAHWMQARSTHFLPGWW